MAITEEFIAFLTRHTTYVHASSFAPSVLQSIIFSDPTEQPHRIKRIKHTTSRPLLPWPWARCNVFAAPRV